MGIYVNQIGYQNNAVKVATTNFACNFQVIQASTQSGVFDGTTVDRGEDACSGEHIYTIDFSALTQPGTYYILAGNGEKSCSFAIGEQVYQPLQRDLLKALYFQRCGCALEEKYAGPYTHAACHTAPVILLSDYLNHTAAPQTFDMNGGWHDAGDYGRYISPAAVAIAHLLYAYKLFPESFHEQLQIPESGNHMPDVLNECLYELKWMLKMQAPDGGAYHKLTSFTHTDFLMPEDDPLPFLIFPVSSMATADFAASMALASRIYAPFEPEFAKQALQAARKAWSWLGCNPYVGFHNPEGSNTGEYDDVCDLDERLWASAELLIADPAHAAEYQHAFNEYSASGVSKTGLGWTDVSGLAMFAILTDETDSCEKAQREEYLALLERTADWYLALQKDSGFALAMRPDDFVWGSNMVVCNRSMLLILAALLFEQKASAYGEGALNQLHYLLGRNAMDVSYVTGEGEKAYRNPHNRTSVSDGIELPMPGWVSGGPCYPPRDPAADAIVPKGSAPMKCYADHIDSYSTNEITIYWNSPAVFMTAFFNRNLSR